MFIYFDKSISFEEMEILMKVRREKEAEEDGTSTDPALG